MEHFTLFPHMLFFSFQMQAEVSLADVQQWFHVLPQPFFSQGLLLRVEKDTLKCLDNIYVKLHVNR